MASEAVPSIEIPDTQVAPETQPAQDSQDANTQAYTESQMLAGQSSQEESVKVTGMIDHFTDAQTDQQQEQVVDFSQEADETAEKVSGEALHRSNAFLEDPMDTDQIHCKKCGCAAELSTVVIRGPKEIWCRSCNALYTLLQRNMRWPPKEFQVLDESLQANFFQRCAEDKRASEASKFSYARVRETLTRSLLDEEIRQRKISVGGTYWPKSVYLQKGYEAERQVKKRRGAQIEEAEATDAKSAKTDAVMVMDLLTESEEESEGQVL